MLCVASYRTAKINQWILLGARLHVCSESPFPDQNQLRTRASFFLENAVPDVEKNENSFELNQSSDEQVIILVSCCVRIGGRPPEMSERGNFFGWHSSPIKLIAHKIRNR